MLKFESYRDDYRDSCLNLFDENCPDFFAENERADYAEFLAKKPKNYKVGLSKGIVSAAFGLEFELDAGKARITWIMVSNSFKGRGVGVEMMKWARALAYDREASVIDIAASHLSAPFFEKFGAIVTKETHNGWGPEMHRIDMELHL